MSGPSKSYLPSQRMMPTYTTVSPPREDTKASTTSDYGYEASDGPKTTSPALPSPYSRIQESPKTVAELAYSRIQESPKTVAELAYSRIQEFPYGISGVPMPSYNYNSELYNYVSNGFPRKSRMCSYCGKVFTRSTTRRYHEKRCPLLRAAGSLMSNNTDNQQRTKTEAKPFSTNTSFPIAAVNSHSPFYGGFPASLYHTTSTNSLDQNRNALNSIKLEPQERKEPQNGRTSRDASLDPPSTRMTPDSENRQMFTPTPTNNSPESMVSRGRNSSSPVGEDHERDKFRNSDRSLDHKTDTSNSVFKYDEASHLHGRPYSHSGTALLGVEKDDEDGERRDSILVDTGQNLFPSRDSAERSRSGLGNGGNEFSGITQGSNEDNELGEITSNKNMTDKQCGLCGKVFNNVQELEAHEQLHTSHKPYACRFCGERFSKVSIRISHERIHMGEKPYVCAICGLSFTRKYSVRVHMRRKHVDGACLCRYCGKTTFDLQSLKDHLLSHDLPKAEKESLNYLNINGEKDDLPDEEDSNENSMSSENNEEEFNGEPAATPEAVEVSTQSKDKEWCRLCEKDIPKSFLRYHERMHADQKPFECPLCKKRFGYKNNMKSHMKLHAGIKPYQCHICGAKFTRGSTLRRHARRHGIVTDTVWDFFTQKQGKMGAPRDVSPSARSKADENSDVSSTRPGPESALVLPDSSHNYDLASLSASAANALYAGYSSLTSLPHGLYPPYSTTSLLQYATGYNPSTSAIVQSDALNLSVSPAPHHFSSKIKLLDNTMDDMGPKSTMETDDVTPESPSEAKPGCRNMGIQVKTCCGADAKGILDSSYDLRMLSPSSFESSGSVATSPSLSSGTETLMNETLSSLLTSGKMFRCSHCYSFFAEYAMYRIHQKLHARDVAHPFMCPSCGEDCYDRMYFSLHLAEHLK